MSPERLLVVCIANICRSPLGEILLQEGIDPTSDIRVASAGTRARPGSTACRRVIDFRRARQWSERAAGHRSRPLEEGLSDGPTLVLTMSTDVRSEVIAIAPSLRSRIFTLREAAHLGEDFTPRRGAPGGGLLSQYVEHLDGARAVRGTVPAKKRRWGGGGPGGPDIADGHNLGWRAHRRTLREVESAASRVCEQLSGAARA